MDTTPARSLGFGSGKTARLWVAVLLTALTILGGAVSQATSNAQSVVGEQVCSSGETKQEGCNTCRCVDGKWACTHKVCPTG
ncbi:hypothetical protein [Nocardia sp. NPDC050175]|uniref:hypothetical protein n=1 Tax=Nocardia sp. NPDC050175 TaxID=3364317 RepID=UPI003787EE8E